MQAGAGIQYSLHMTEFADKNCLYSTTHGAELMNYTFRFCNIELPNPYAPGPVGRLDRTPGPPDSVSARRLYVLLL